MSGLGRPRSARAWRGARITALIAIAWSAVEATHIKHSHFIRPDLLAIFCDLIATWFALRVADEPRLKNYLFAGMGIGFIMMAVVIMSAANKK